MILDAENAVLGRVASRAAKEALNGNEVSIVNAEKAVLSGSPKVTYERHIMLKNKVTHRQHGPFYSTRPDLFVKRTVRGMLPYKKTRGKEAYKRIRAYLGVPEELKGKEMIKIEKDVTKLGTLKYTTIGKVCSRLGWNDANR